MAEMPLCHRICLGHQWQPCPADRAILKAAAADLHWYNATHLALIQTGCANLHSGRSDASTGMVQA